MTTKIIYLDHAASTPLDPIVKKEMGAVKTYANPSALHQMGLEAKEILNNSRNKVAKILNCKPEEIIFTSGGTESINLALKGIGKGHIITSKIDFGVAIIRKKKNQNILDLNFKNFKKLKFNNYYYNHKNFLNIKSYDDTLKYLNLDK